MCLCRLGKTLLPKDTCLEGSPGEGNDSEGGRWENILTCSYFFSFPPAVFSSAVPPFHVDFAEEEEMEDEKIG